MCLLVFVGRLVVASGGETPWERAVSTKDQDKYCQHVCRDRGSTCQFKANREEAFCFSDKEIDCSKRTVFE
jgi:hypothetical protein